STYSIIIFLNIYIKIYFFFFQAEDGIRDYKVTGVQTCALPISLVIRRLINLTTSRCRRKFTRNLRITNAKEQADSNPYLSKQHRSEERRVGKECRSRWLQDH